MLGKEESVGPVRLLHTCKFLRKKSDWESRRKGSTRWGGRRDNPKNRHSLSSNYGLGTILRSLKVNNTLNAHDHPLREVLP